MQPKVLRADAGDEPLSLDEYCARPHVQVSPTASTHGMADEWLQATGRKRRVVLSVPQFSALPGLLADTDLLVSLPDYIAEAMAASGQLRYESLPFETPVLELDMVWLSMLDNDPAESWLRQRLEALMGETD
ncbi:Nodulation protein D 2 [compost metagenome]